MAYVSARYANTVTAGLAAATLLCLWGSIEQYRLESAYQEQSRDPYLIGQQVSRFGALKQAVPENAELGYLTDMPAGSAEEGAMWFGAQYVLAPRLLAKGAEHDLVLGNFTRPADFAALGERNGLQLQQDFGNGVILYRRKR
jgi:hypothetical protein